MAQFEKQISVRKMKIFITGATGFIGTALTKKLVEDGNLIHALIRTSSKSGLIDFENVILKKGNLLNKESLYHGMMGCEQVYHLAAYAKPWAKDPGIYYNINVQGTLNVLTAAVKAGIKKVVITSTAGVLGPSDGKSLKENSVNNTLPFTEYERTKIIMEEKVLVYAKRKIQVVIVLPSRLYGPGQLTVSNSVTKMIRFYLNGIWPVIPGNGQNLGNYVFIDDVISGLILAMKNGKPGERYIIGGETVSYNEFFETLSKASGKNRLMIKTPLKILLIISRIQLHLAKLTDKPPISTPDWIKKYCHSWAITSNKAKDELGYRITPLYEGMLKTIEWLKGQS